MNLTQYRKLTPAEIEGRELEIAISLAETYFLKPLAERKAAQREKTWHKATWKQVDLFKEGRRHE